MATKMNKQFHLPISRVKTIMKSSPDVENISSESIHLVAKATELFIQYLARESFIGSNNSKELKYEYVAEIVERDQRFEFLRELIPQKITIREYKEILSKGELNSSYENESD